MNEWVDEQQLAQDSEVSWGWGWGYHISETFSNESKPCISSAAASKSLQLCPTLCDPIDGSPPGSPVPGILQARTLEWVAISFSNAWKWKVKVKSFSRVRLLVTPMDCSLPGSPVHGIFQARVLEWGAIAFSAVLAQVLSNPRDSSEYSINRFLWSQSSKQLFGKVCACGSFQVKGSIAFTGFSSFYDPWSIKNHCPPPGQHCLRKGLPRKQYHSFTFWWRHCFLCQYHFTAFNCSER